MYCLICAALVPPRSHGAQYAYFTICLACCEAGYRFAWQAGRMMIPIPADQQHPESYIPVGVVAWQRRHAVAAGKERVIEIQHVQSH